MAKSSIDTQMSILVHITENPGCSAAEVAEALGLEFQVVRCELQQMLRGKAIAVSDAGGIVLGPSLSVASPEEA